MEENGVKEKSWLINALIFSCAVSVIVSFYFFYYKKDFDFIVESPCDPTREECFKRDCSNPDDCPQNGFSDFKRYSLNANDFKFCTNEDCTAICESEVIKCEQLECEPDEEVGESCVSPDSEQKAE